MLTGGCQIVNFKSTPLTVAGGEIAIDGIYAIVNHNYNVSKKATLISGLVVGDVAYPDFYAAIELDGSDYKFVSHGTQTVTIKEGDLVTVAE